MSIAPELLQQLEDFRRERIAHIEAGVNLGPSVFQYNGAKTVLHIVPSNAADGIVSALKSNPNLTGREAPIQNPEKADYFPLPRIDSYNTFDENFTAYTTIWDNGNIEAVETFLVNWEDGPIREAIFPEWLSIALQRYLGLLSAAGVSLPVYVMLSLVGVVGDAPPPGANDAAIQPLIHGSNLELPPITVLGFEDKPSEFMQPAFDTVWQLFQLQE